MKLISKNILLNAILSIIILFIGEFSLYHLLKTKIEKETIEHLNIERFFLLKKIKKGIDINSFKNNIGDKIIVEPIDKIEYKTPVVEDFNVEEEWEEEHFSSKKITFDVMQNNVCYRVTIIKTIDEDEDISSGMWVIIFVSGLSILLVLTLVNIIVSKKIFAPIYKLNSDINEFTINKQSKIKPPKTTTPELKELGDSISKMSEKILRDYNSMKEFIENITHEIQTPLAVINSKIERSLQEPSLTQEQAFLLSDAAKASNKLFTISKGLSLLSGLDNEQYTKRQEIHLTELVNKRLLFFSDFIENKKLTLSTHYNSEVILNADVSLCEILIDNLIKNAVKHNFESGTIDVLIDHKELIISNTGQKPEEEIDNYFKRFYSKSDNESLGLGLSIIKKIVEYYNFSISYVYEHNKHKVSVKF